MITYAKNTDWHWCDCFSNQNIIKNKYLKNPFGLR